MNVTWLLEPQEAMCLSSELKDTVATHWSPSMLVFAWRRVE